jgi:membrane-associated protease RseP (regulator of RpoE activity)
MTRIPGKKKINIGRAPDDVFLDLSEIDEFVRWGEHPYIGVELSTLTEQLGEYFGVEKGNGALITTVSEDSPAEKAGLKAGDVIVAIDGEQTRDIGDIQELIREKEADEIARVTVVRNKSKQTVDVQVAEPEESDHPRAGYFFHAPDMPKINLDVPRMRGLFHGDGGAKDRTIILDSDNFKKDMQELREELQKLKKELEQLKKDSD